MIATSAVRVNRPGAFLALACNQGHIWEVRVYDVFVKRGQFGDEHVRRMDDPRRPVACPECRRIYRAEMAAVLEAPDYLRVPGGAE